MSSVIDTALLTPEDLYSQARGFGVDLDREPYLLPLMKQAATTPKPPKRQQNDGGNDGERYFLDQIKLLRQQVANGKQEEETSAWMAFEEVISPEVGNAATKKYYYDFISKTRR